MNKYFQLAFFGAALLLTSCSNDVETPVKTKSGTGAIEFQTWQGKKLRAATTLGTMREFSVGAYSPEGVIYSNISITNAGGVCTYTTPSDKAPWPFTATVNFFAMSPYAPVGVNNTPTDLAAAVSPTVSYTTPANIADMEDLLLARNIGSFLSNAETPVPMNFRHVLSRMVVNVESPGDMDFVVDSLSFENVYKTGTLTYDSIPANITGLVYPSVNTATRRTMWASPSNLGRISAEIAEGGVTVLHGTANKANLIGTDDNPDIYILPQTTIYSGTTITDAATGIVPAGFYLRITYHPAKNPVQVKTWQIPVADLLAKANTGIVFEVERQYTFNLRIQSSGRIEFTTPEVALFQDEIDIVTDVPKQKLVWAGSNIYWEDGHMTFAAPDAENIETKQHYQGLAFRWGSLMGVSLNSSGFSGASCYLANSTTTKPSWSTYPYINTESLVVPGLDIHDPSQNIGDICRHISDLGNAPDGRKWRLPTAAEISSNVYVRVPVSSGFSAASLSNIDGKGAIPSGYTSQGVFFPASGMIVSSSGSPTLYFVGEKGAYWASTPASTINGSRFTFEGTGTTAAGYERTAALAVRCVRE